MIVVMTSSSLPLGGQLKGPGSWERMSQRGQHEPLSAQDLHGPMITAKMEEVWRGYGRGRKVMTLTAAEGRAGNGERLFSLPLSHVDRDEGNVVAGPKEKPWF